MVYANGNVAFIAGCGFGSSVVRGGVYITGPNGFKSYLDPTKWSDQHVTAAIDPKLSGVPDADHTITLVVNGLKATGLSFYAARDTYRLPSIPLSAVRISATTPAAAPVTTCFITCTAVEMQYGPNPDSPFVGPYPEVVGVSGEMLRWGDSYFTVAGPDVYDFSQLAPGFALDSAGASFFAITQADCNDAVLDGYPGEKLSDNGTSAQAYSVTEPNKFLVTPNVWDCYNYLSLPQLYPPNLSWSMYDLSVEVQGPRGLQNPQIWISH